MIINVINKSNNPLPEYKTKSAAGMDLLAHTNKSILIKPTERVLVSTGLFIELPEGFEAQIRPRSGLALNHGISIVNTPGTIDADYRGEIKILLINHGKEDFMVNNGDRIAQMVICKIEKAILNTVEYLNETDRAEGGYGHTGKN